MNRLHLIINTLMIDINLLVNIVLNTMLKSINQLPPVFNGKKSNQDQTILLFTRKSR